MDRGEAGSLQVSADERYRAIVEDARLGVYASRPDGRLIACNPAFARILGFASVDDALGSRHGDAPRHAGAARGVHEAAAKATAPLNGRGYRFDDGTAGPSRCSPPSWACSMRGELVEAHGFILDVTESAQAEAVLAERERGFDRCSSTPPTRC